MVGVSLAGEAAKPTPVRVLPDTVKGGDLLHALTAEAG